VIGLTNHSQQIRSYIMNKGNNNIFLTHVWHSFASTP